MVASDIKVRIIKFVEIKEAWIITMYKFASVEIL
jgi:hypothetical protein